MELFIDSADVDADNDVSIAWLKWLGFAFEDEPMPYGILQRPFLKFSMGVADV